MALATQTRFADTAAGWRKRSIDLALGIGIEAGYATLGRIGFEGRFDYGALGSATNLAARLCSHASGGQTLIGQRVFAATEEAVETAPVGSLELKGFGRPVLKGFGRPVVAHEVRRLREPPTYLVLAVVLPKDSAHTPASRIAEERFSRGEITAAELDRIRRDLQAAS